MQTSDDIEAFIQRWSQTGQRADIPLCDQNDNSATTAPAARQLRPSGLPAQIKALAAVLAGAGRPLALAELEARFNARGRWQAV